MAPETFLSTKHCSGLLTYIYTLNLHNTAVRELQSFSPSYTWSYKQRQARLGFESRAEAFILYAAYLVKSDCTTPLPTFSSLMMPFLLPESPFFILLIWLVPPSSLMEPPHHFLLSVPMPFVLSIYPVDWKLGQSRHYILLYGSVPPVPDPRPGRH